LISRDLRHDVIVKSWLTQFYGKCTHIHCTDVYEKKHALLTFTAFATHFLSNTTQTLPYNAKALFCKNNN